MICDAESDVGSRAAAGNIVIRVFVDVAEQCAVTVDEIAALAVAHRRLLFAVARSEPFRKQRILLTDERSTRRGVNHSTNVEFHNITTATTTSSSSR